MDKRQTQEDELFIPTPEQVAAAVGMEPEEAVELSNLTAEEKLIGAKILPAVTARVRAAAQAEAAKQLAQQTQELIAQNNRMMQDEVEKLRNSIKPPDPEQLEKLLSQEYGEMEFQIKMRKKNETRTFVLREMPQAAEKRFFKMVADKIVPHIKELAQIEWAQTASRAEQVQRMLEIIPDGLDTLAECCAICLDPFKEDSITVEWVQSNMGSNRIVNVIEAQLTVSKMRDFISAAYRLLPGTPKKG